MAHAPHSSKAVAAAHLGCAAAAGYAVLKAAWASGSTVGVNADAAAWEAFLQSMGGPLVALWGTVLLALLASAILLSLVQPWGRRVPRRLRASLAWLGFATMVPVGLAGLGSTLSDVIASSAFPLLTPATYICVYTCFVVLGLSFAVTVRRTRSLDPAPATRRRRRPRFAPPLNHPLEDR